MKPTSPRLRLFRLAAATAPSAGDVLAAALGLTGWSAGPPPWLSNEGRAADAELAAAPCPVCNAPGGAYLPFFNAATRTYRGFALCGSCGVLGEF